MPDSPRWCDYCKAYGEHHTDRCPTHALDVRTLELLKRPTRAALDQSQLDTEDQDGG